MPCWARPGGGGSGLTEEGPARLVRVNRSREGSGQVGSVCVDEPGAA